jgi:thioredoxin reductase (NADPH)
VRHTDDGIPELLVVGAGPCGLGAGIAARRAGLRAVLIDKGCVVSSIASYPAFMTFFSTADRLEIGGVPFIVAGDKPTRREAIRYYQRLATHFELDVRQYEQVDAVVSEAGAFRIDTTSRTGIRGVYRAANVAIATGYFDHPNQLGVPGEDLPHVLHGYREGHAFYRQRCIIVGGGNSAVDAALELNRWGAHVTIVHFAEALDRNVKPWVQPEIAARLAANHIRARFHARIVEILPDAVIVRDELDGTLGRLPADWVLEMTGYTPDPMLLHALGVRFDPATGIPEHDPATMETNVPGVFIAGVIVAGNDANKVFIENGRDHGARIVDAIVQRGADAPGMRRGPVRHGQPSAR